MDKETKFRTEKLRQENLKHLMKKKCPRVPTNMLQEAI